MLRGGRYEIHNATMVDLIKTAYSIDADKVLGGPNWLEFDRFDVIAKADSKTPQDTLKLMLQALLAERFKLMVHKDTQSIAGFALAAGKGKPKLKEAASTEKTGCQRQAQAPLTTVEGQIRLPMNSVSCHNVTMEAFASQLRGMDPTYFTNAVIDSTGLKGNWDFDLKWAIKGNLRLAGPDAVTISEAVDKQLGLKIEEQKIPTPVIVVDQVERKPTDNPPDVNARVPALPPAEFEVSDVKPTVPGSRPSGAIMLGMQPGGRVNLPGFPLALAIQIAWNLNGSIADIQGAPKWITSTNFDIVAKAPAEYVPSSGGGGGPDEMGPMLQALLKDRFKMKVHYEDQLVTAYTLVAAKPKLKKADPASRIGCKVENAPNAIAAGPLPLPARLVTCQNITMAQFVDQLQALVPASYIRYPVLDATGIEGAWDFSFTFSPINPAQIAGPRGAPPTGGAGPADIGAADPVGGVTLFDAVEKQLGLKLEAQKRMYPVFVIDHIDEKPTEN
jgi:uncharacterized protein (TIGR03435 family)